MSCVLETLTSLSIPFIQSMSENKKKATIAQRMVSSGTSALITKTIVTPFDVVKTYIQVGQYILTDIKAEFTFKERKQVINVCVSSRIDSRTSARR